MDFFLNEFHKGLKQLSEILANETSNKILQFLYENEGYSGAIAKKLELDIDVVLYHLKKMNSFDLLKYREDFISKRSKTKHKIYRLKKGVKITIFFKNNKNVLSGIGFGIITFFGTSLLQKEFMATITPNIVNEKIPVNSNEFILPLILSVCTFLSLLILLKKKKRS